MPRPTRRPSLVRGRVARVTRLDGCGRFIYGEYNQAVTDGIITVAFTSNTNSTDEISVVKMDGKRCIYEPSLPELSGYSIDVTFCAVEPEIFEIITGQTLVFDAFGRTVGIEMDTKIKLDDKGFGFELWAGSGNTDACEDEEADGEFGYVLLPRLQGGVLGDFSVENGAVNFVITGAATRDGNQWGRGPYAVDRAVGTDEVQRATISGTPTGGNFTLTFNGQTTANIAYNATAAAVQTALQALSTVGAGNVTVTGGPGPGTPYTFTFTNDLGQANQPALTATASFTGGTSPAIAITTITPGTAPAPAPLFQALSPTAALRLQAVTVAPPEPFIGARPLLNPTLPALTSIAAVEGSTDMEADFTTTPGATGPVWWDFGDGEWDYVVAPGSASHLYAAPGTYTVKASQNGKSWTKTTVTVPFP